MPQWAAEARRIGPPATTETTLPLWIYLLAMSKEDSTTSEGRSRTVGTPASFCRQRAEVFITCMKNVVENWTIPGGWQGSIWEPEKGQWVCGGDPGLWGCWAGRCSPGHSGSIKSILPGPAEKVQAYSSIGLQEKSRIYSTQALSGNSWRGSMLLTTLWRMEQVTSEHNCLYILEVTQPSMTFLQCRRAKPCK